MTFTPTPTPSPTPFLGLVKTAYPNPAKPLDRVSFTISFINEGTSPVFGAAVTDVLPPAAQMVYVPGSASNGGVYGSGMIVWSIASLPVGTTVQMTYQEDVALTAVSGGVHSAVNLAEAVYPGGTLSSSVTVELAGGYLIHLAVFNSVGEMVKDLSTFNMGAPLAGFTVVNGVIETDTDVAQFLYNGTPLGSWDATNKTGGKVQNGTYIVKVDSTDPYGVTSTTDHEIAVVIGRNTLTADVYNEAGETVRTFSQAELTGLLGGSLTAEDYDVSKVHMEPGRLSPGATGTAGSNAAVTITMGSGRTFAWDGRGDAGGYLTSGQYYMEVKSTTQGKPDQQIVMPVNILDTGADGVDSVALGPNPVELGKTTRPVFMVRTTNGLVTGFKVRIYALTGELVKVLENDPGKTDEATWDLGGGGVASGLYIAVIEIHAGDGILARKTLKVAILH